MQEQIYRDETATGSIQKQQEQQQHEYQPTQLMTNQMLRSTQQKHVQRASHSSQLNQLHQSKIITPTKSTQYELLAGITFINKVLFMRVSFDSRHFCSHTATVKEVFYQVEEAFKSRYKLHFYDKQIYIE